jgi:DNA-binding NtrC family response regulator
VRPEDLPERVREHAAARDAEAAAAHEHAAAGSTDAGNADAASAGVAPASPEEGTLASLSELEGRHIARVLAHTGGNKQAAARVLGIDRTTLQRMIKRHGLDAGTGARANGDGKAHAEQPGEKDATQRHRDTA